MSYFAGFGLLGKNMLPQGFKQLRMYWRGGQNGFIEVSRALGVWLENLQFRICLLTCILLYLLLSDFWWAGLFSESEPPPTGRRLGERCLMDGQLFDYTMSLPPGILQQCLAEGKSLLVRETDTNPRRAGLATQREGPQSQ